jgi:hypothetical protein
MPWQAKTLGLSMGEGLERLKLEPWCVRDGVDELVAAEALEEAAPVEVGV